MERINTLNGCHFFIACRKDRPKASYKVDFAPDAAVNYIPASGIGAASWQHRSPVPTGTCS